MAAPQDSRKLALLMLLTVGALGACVTACSPPLGRYERALVAAFDDRASENLRFKLDCPGFDCAELLPLLPVVAPQDVVCDAALWRIWPLALSGACCVVRFQDLGVVEAHIFRIGAKYEIELKGFGEEVAPALGVMPLARRGAEARRKDSPGALPQPWTPGPSPR